MGNEYEFTGVNSQTPVQIEMEFGRDGVNFIDGYLV